jgi:hypothetical protein
MAPGVIEYVNKTRSYQPLFRFQLTDKTKRLFSANRWCFLGNIEDWHLLDSERSLADLAKKYLKHIRKQSFYELG